MLYLGISLGECIAKLTGSPAGKLKLSNIGEIKPGYKGDFTILKPENKYLELEDSTGKRVEQKPYVEALYSVVGGRVYKSESGN